MNFIDNFERRSEIKAAALEIVSRLPITAGPVIFATDIDGTITDNKERVPKSTSRQLGRAARDNIQIVFITGRTPNQLTQKFKNSVFPPYTFGRS